MTNPTTYELPAEAFRRDRRDPGTMLHRVARMVVDCSYARAPVDTPDLHNAGVIIRFIIESLAQEAGDVETSLYDPPYDKPVLLADWLRERIKSWETP